MEASIRQATWVAHSVGRADLAPLGPNDISELAHLLREDHYPAGATLFREGQAPSRIHIVRTGAVELSCELKGRRVGLQIVHPGDVIGDAPVFLRRTEPFDAVALKDSVVLSIDSVDFHRLLEQRSALAWRWLLSVSERMAGYQARIVELLTGGLDAQIAAVLVRRAEDGVVRLSQTSLAELVGGQRTSVNRVLKRLEARKLVRVGYAQVEILDEARLTVAAGLA